MPLPPDVPRNVMELDKLQFRNEQKLYNQAGEYHLAEIERNLNSLSTAISS